MSNVLYVNNLEKQIAAKNQLIAELRQQLTATTDQIAAAVAACKVKDDALRQARYMIYYDEPQISWDITRIDEALTVMPSISEWKTRWQKKNGELRQQLADSVADRNNLAKALQFAVNMHTDGSEFFACLPDEITYAAEKELREFFRLVDITNMEPKP